MVPVLVRTLPFYDRSPPFPLRHSADIANIIMTISTVIAFKPFKLNHFYISAKQVLFLFENAVGDRDFCAQYLSTRRC
jgi:hypothetical protein